MRLAQALQVDQLVVAALVAQELGVRATLDDLALVKHVDDVGLLDRAETVGHSNGGPTTSGGVQGGLNNLFRLGVQGRGGLVQQQDLGITQESAGDGDTLLLAARQHASLATDDGVEALTVDNGLA